MAGLSDDYLGKGPAAFKQMRKNLNQEKVSVYDIKWKGSMTSLPVFKISIKDLRYNLFNTRIKPHLLQHIAQNSLPEDHFSTIDKDALSVQRMVNGFLRKNHDRKSALKFFKSGELPVAQEPLVSTIDGRVLNGNQRLCVFRELFDGNPSKYSHLQTAYVAFLPDNGTYEDERELEATFQETKLAAVPFDWIQSGLWAIEERKKPGKTPAKIGKTLGISEAEALFQIQRITLAREFLKYIGKEEFWYSLREMNLLEAFKTLVKEQNRLKSKAQRDALKDGAFAMMKDPKKAGGAVGKSVHLLIGNLAKNLDDFEFDSDDVSEDSSSPNDILRPRNKKKAKKKAKAEKINTKTIKPADLAKKVADAEDIRSKKHKAKLEKDFGKRMMKSATTSFDGIIENWENIEKKGLKSRVNKALTRLKKIKKMIDKE